MVGPSITDEDRESQLARLKYGFVLLVGASGGLIALQGGASVAVMAVAFVAGLAVGTVLWYYLAAIVPE